MRPNSRAQTLAKKYNLGWKLRDWKIVLNSKVG